MKTDADLESGPDFAAVARVATSSQLGTVVLRDCFAVCDTPTEHVPPGWTDTTFVGYSTSIVPCDAENSFRATAEFIAAYAAGTDLRELGPDAVPEGEAPEVLLQATFALTYTYTRSVELQEGDLDEFAKINSTLHAWPYWRELAQSMTTRMGLPPLMVPMYKLPYVNDPE